jgi:hypothetical protein
MRPWVCALRDCGGSREGEPTCEAFDRAQPVATSPTATT